MSTLMERIDQAAALSATINQAGKEAAKFEEMIRADQNKIQKAVKDKLKDFNPDKLEAKIAANVKHADALWDRTRQARLELAKMEDEQLDSLTIKHFSPGKRFTQIVIQCDRGDGKKVSYTRHVKNAPDGYVGRSTLTNQKVHYYATVKPTAEEAPAA